MSNVLVEYLLGRFIIFAKGWGVSSSSVEPDLTNLLNSGHYCLIPSSTSY